MRVFKPLEVAGSALTAHRLWMDLIAQNMANVNTTRSAEGGPYRRKVPVFQERLDAKLLQEKGVDAAPFLGVRVRSVEEDPTPPRLVYDPSHPDADGEGYVRYPNVNPIREMADMLVATRAYEANLRVVDSFKAMWSSALEVLRA